MAQAQTLFLTNLLNGIHNQRDTVERRVYLGRDISGGTYIGTPAVTTADFAFSKGYCVLPNSSGLVVLDEDAALNKSATYKADDLSFAITEAGTFNTILLVAYDTATDTKRLIGYRTLSSLVVVPDTISPSHDFKFNWSFGVKGQSAA